MQLMNWLVGQGLTGLPESELVRGFCERCRAAGVELSRGLVVIDTLHPIFEGRGFRWNDIVTDEGDSSNMRPAARGPLPRTGATHHSITCWKTATMSCASISPMPPRPVFRSSLTTPPKVTGTTSPSCIGSAKPEPWARWIASIPAG